VRGNGLDHQRLGYSGDDLGRLDICNLMMKEAANWGAQGTSTD